MRITASAQQQNRTANVLKGLQGLGCRVQKDLTANGSNWLVIVDGSSDVSYPPGWSAPWQTKGASIRLYASAPSDGIVTFAEKTYETNSDILESVDEGGGTYTTIQCKKTGIYTVSLQCTMKANVGVSNAYAGCSMLDSGDSHVLTNELEQRYVDKLGGGSDERIMNSQSASMDFYTLFGGTYTIEAYTNNGVLSALIWCMRYVEEYTA